MAPYWDTIKVAGKHLLKWRCWLDLYLKDSVFPKPSSWFSLIPKPAPPSENGTTTYPKSRLHTTHTLFHITHFQTSTNSLPPESPHTFVPETTPRSGHLPLGPPRPLPPSFQSAPVTPVTFLCECKSDSVFPSLPVLFRRTDARVPHLADKIWNHRAHSQQDSFHLPLQVLFIPLHSAVRAESSLVIRGITGLPRHLTYGAFVWGSFSGGSVSKETACNAGDLGLTPGSGRSPGEGNHNPLQYSWLGNPTDRGAQWATVHGIARVGHELATKPPRLMKRWQWGGGWRLQSGISSCCVASDCLHLLTAAATVKCLFPRALFSDKYSCLPLWCPGTTFHSWVPYSHVDFP